MDAAGGAWWAATARSCRAIAPDDIAPNHVVGVAMRIKDANSGGMAEAREEGASTNDG
jgi:hypothetical protein